MKFEFNKNFFKTNDDNKWIIIAIDYNIKWSIIKTISKTIAETFVDFIINNIYKNYETFKKIIIDRNVNL